LCIDNITGVRRRKSSIEKSQDEEEDVGGNKQRVLDSSVSSVISSTPEVVNEEINTVEKPSVSVRKPIALNQNGSTGASGDEQVLKKKRGRKPKTETNNDSIV
jgi:hypothetical protein